MPLLGKIVVIKRNGGDGTEFPLTASCLFGRKLDCDIRIQLPQVSKEHCKIELNENKELILTNLSSVNPTRINGEVFNQSERLKHGDLITIIDRSFRFEYPPPKTPKRLSTAGKDQTSQALQDQHSENTPIPVEKRRSEQSFDTCLKDGSNRAPVLEHTDQDQVEDGKRKKDSMSPFGELYHMVKQDLVAKSPWKPELTKTHLARTPVHCHDVHAEGVKGTPKQLTTPSINKKRRSSKHNLENTNASDVPPGSVNVNLEEVLSGDGESTTKQRSTPSSTKKRISSKHNFENTNASDVHPNSLNVDLEEVFSGDVESTPKQVPYPSSTKKQRSSKHNFENTNASDVPPNTVNVVLEEVFSGDVESTPKLVSAPLSTKKQRSSKHIFENTNASDVLPNSLNVDLEEVFSGDVQSTQKQVSTPSSTKKRRSSKHNFENTNASDVPPGKVNVNLEESLSGDVENTPKPVSTPLSSKKRRSSKHNFENTNASDVPPNSVNVGLEESLSGVVESTPSQASTPTSSKKQRFSLSKSEEMMTPADVFSSEEMPSVESNTPKVKKSSTPVSQIKKTPLKSPQFSADEVVQQVLFDEPQPKETPKSSKGRRSGEVQSQSLSPQTPLGQGQTPGQNGDNVEAKPSPRTSPRSNAGKRFQVQDVLDEIKAVSSPCESEGSSIDEDDGIATHFEASVTRPKRKRVSFGGQLSPELFDKRLPPNSPLRRGATPRRSLGPFNKPQSLLRRASTIGLLALRVKGVSEGQKSSPKKASPKRPGTAVKTPSPAKRSPVAKAKTPSPKHRSPSFANKASTPASPKTPASARRASTSAVESTGNTSSPETPRVQGRFSISRISTPSPVLDQPEMAEVKSTVLDQKGATPKMKPKRKSMKSSERKPPKSSIKNVMDVMRSRRSGASRANLKVLSSWADIVKFGQTKPQAVLPKKKSVKSKVVMRAVAVKPKTPVRRLKENVSTGHAASPATIVVGKAHMRPNHAVGFAPKIIPNMVLFKKDMKMDEDLTGVADIFKTPANLKAKNAVIGKESSEVHLEEISGMKTPEESGEMMVSPLSVVSIAPCEKYNSEAVTRLLLDNQDGSVLENESLAQETEEANDDIVKESEPKTVIKTPKQKPEPYSNLTGVKRLMKTPKQKCEPIEDLRGKLLKTPRVSKAPQEESLEGVKELLKTPKYRGVPVEDMVGVKRVMQTPKQKNSPVLCAAGLHRIMQTPKEPSEQLEDFTGLEELMKTPKVKDDVTDQVAKTLKRKRSEIEEDLTGVQLLMKTPKHRGKPVEEKMGIKRLMQIPKEKHEQVEDLTGVKELMKTPKEKREPVDNHLGIRKLMKISRVTRAAVEEDFTGLKELVEEPENYCKSTTENTASEFIEVSDLALNSGSANAPTEELECDKENLCPIETVEVECWKSAITDIPDFNHSSHTIESLVPTDNTECLSDVLSKDEIEEQLRPTENTSVTVDVCTSEQDEVPVNCLSAKKEQHNSQGVVAEKDTNEALKIPALLTLVEEEKQNVQLPPSPVKARRGRKALEVPEVTASPIRKSARGRLAKQSNVEEVKDETARIAEKAQKLDDLPPVTKPKRGRRAKQNIVEVSLVTEELNLDTAVQSSESVPEETAQDSAEPIFDAPAVEQQVQAPVVQSGRRKKMDKTEKQPLGDSETSTEPVLGIASQYQAHQVPVGRSGRRKKVVKTEKQPSEDPQDSTEPIVDAFVAKEQVQAAVVRSGRRKKVDKAENLIPRDGQDSTEPSVIAPAAEEQVQAPVAKSGRRKKVEKTEKQPSEDAQESTELIADAPAAEEQDQAPVVQSGRRMKVSKTVKQPSEDAQDSTKPNVAPPAAEEQVQAPVVRSGRRKKLEKSDKQPSHNSEVSAEPILDAPASEEQVQTPVVRSGRRKKLEKSDKQPSDDSEVSVEPILDAPASEEQVQAPVVRSGRRKKLEKSDKQPSDDSEVSTEPILDAPAAEEQVQAPVVRSGRRKKMEKSDKQPSDDFEVATEPTANAPAAEELAQASVVKSGRGRKMNRTKKNSKEHDDKKLDSVCDVDVPEASIFVGRSRRGLATNKEPVSSEPFQDLESEKPSATPVAEKPHRGRRGQQEAITDQPLDDQVKRGTKKSKVTVTKVVDQEETSVISGHKQAIAKNEAEVSVKRGRRAVAEPSQHVSECVAAEDAGVEVERGRGKKLLAKRDLIKEATRDKPRKKVNWSLDVIAVEDTEKIELSTAGPPSKKYKGSESNQPTDLAVKVRRGRGAAKKELAIEDHQEESQTQVKVARGKAVASEACQSEPTDGKASTPMKRKRNGGLEEIESLKDAPLPKRKGRVAKSSCASVEVSSKDEASEAEEEMAELKSAKQQKMLVQELEPISTQEPFSGKATRRGRRVKTLEEVVEAAPVRRTRRK